MRWVVTGICAVCLIAGIGLIALGVKLVGVIIIVVGGIIAAPTVGGMAGAAGSSD
jgi:hypothetical protein